MDDKNNSPIVSEEEVEDTITFTFKRTHFYALLVPMAFLIGIGLGYAFWGRSSPSAAGQTGIQQDGGVSAEADQAAPRYDVPIAENDPVLGPEDAPVTIIEFSDFECPFCRRHNLDVFPQLAENYQGKVRFVYKDFPLTSIHANAFPAAEAALCAHEQGAFWDYRGKLFTNQSGLSEQSYEKYASELNLDLSSFTECMEEKRYSDEVQSDFDFAVQLGVRSTPTFFINGIAIVGAQPYETFAQVIDSELAGE